MPVLVPGVTPTKPSPVKWVWYLPYYFPGLCRRMRGDVFSVGRGRGYGAWG